MPLYKFHLDCGENGEIFGLFEASQADVAIAVGCRVVFYDALGRNSEVSRELKSSDLTRLDVDDDFIETARRAGLIPFGYNPLDYIDG